MHSPLWRVSHWSGCRFARLHCLRDLSNQVDGQQTIGQIGAGNADLIGKFESVFKRSAGNAAMQVAFALRFAFVARDRQQVRLECQVQIVLRETGDRNSDASPVLTIS